MWRKFFSQIFISTSRASIASELMCKRRRIRSNAMCWVRVCECARELAPERRRNGEMHSDRFAYVCRSAHHTPQVSTHLKLNETRPASSGKRNSLSLNMCACTCLCVRMYACVLYSNDLDRDKLIALLKNKLSVSCYYISFHRQAYMKSHFFLSFIL